MDGRSLPVPAVSGPPARALRRTRQVPHRRALSPTPGRTREELELREASWSAQFYPDKFALLQPYGVRMQNLVYYRSSGAFSDAATHYFVMTTELDALHAFGVLLVADAPELLAPSNVDVARLELYTRAAIALFVPLLKEQPMVPGQLSLFDFSERWQSSKAAALVPPLPPPPHQPASRAAADPPPLLATRVGDALQVLALHLERRSLASRPKVKGSTCVPQPAHHAVCS